MICRALFDFKSDYSEELDLKVGDTIRVVSRLDENWLHGELNGRQGRFPTNFVEFLTPNQSF